MTKFVVLDVFIFLVFIAAISVVVWVVFPFKKKEIQVEYECPSCGTKISTENTTLPTWAQLVREFSKKHKEHGFELKKGGEK